MANKEYYLKKLADLLEDRGIRKHTCINGMGYSQIERDIVDLFIETPKIQYVAPLSNEQLVEIDNFKQELELKTMAETKHTPLDWVLRTSKSEVEIVGDYHSPDSILELPNTTKNYANAKLICKAVNNHERLLEVLELACKRIQETYDDSLVDRMRNLLTELK